MNAHRTRRILWKWNHAGIAFFQVTKWGSVPALSGARGVNEATLVGECELASLNTAASVALAVNSLHARRGTRRCITAGEAPTKTGEE